MLVLNEEEKNNISDYTQYGYEKEKKTIYQIILSIDMRKRKRDERLQKSNLKRKKITLSPSLQDSRLAGSGQHVRSDLPLERLPCRYDLRQHVLIKVETESPSCFESTEHERQTYTFSMQHLTKYIILHENSVLSYHQFLCIIQFSYKHTFAIQHFTKHEHYTP